MKKNESSYNDDFSVTADEFLSQLEALERNRALQKELLSKTNILKFPQNVPVQKMETRL